VIAAACLAALAATAAFTALSLRLASLVSTVLAAYLAAVAEVALLTTVLSPVRAVTRTGLVLGQLVLLVVAFGVWWILGRPRPHAPVRDPARSIVRDPVAVLLLGVCAAALAYELVLVLGAPPNNWDSLTYHLTRAAAWAQHGGVYWVTGAPTDRINEFQPLAEQAIMYLFVVAGSDTLFALPQFAAELATIVAVYGIARRLGHGPAAASSAAGLFGTLTLVALEATTGQNDLVAASLPAAAAVFLLGSSRREVLLAGAAVGLAVGVKLTTLFVLPALVLLALLRGRRAVLEFSVAGFVAFAALGVWGFVRNVAETGHVLGRGGGRLEHTPEASVVGPISTAFRAAYRLLDLSGFDGWLIWGLALAGAGIAFGVVVALWGRRSPRAVAGSALAVSLPLLLPALVLVVAGVSHGVAEAVGLPVDQKANTASSFLWEVNRDVNEDESAFGPIGVLLVGASFVTLVAAARRRADPRKLALALALPVSLVGVAVMMKYSPWLSRFLLAPLALTVPLLAVVLRRRSAGLAIALVAALTVGLAHTRNIFKPLDGDVLPWRMTQAQAVDLPWLTSVAASERALDRLAPGPACIGALVGRDDPSYLLYGDGLRRHVTFLTVPGEWQRAEREGMSQIVFDAGDYQDARGRLKGRGWKLERIGYWLFATNPRAPERCTSE
jgi:Glycosyltransferase family 87